MTVQFERARLDHRLASEGPALSRQVIGAFLGRHFSTDAPFSCSLGDARIVVMDSGRSWRVIGRGGGVSEGAGTISLIARVFNVSPGAAAQLIIEAVNGSRIPAEIGHAIRVAIDHGGVLPGGVMTR